MVFLYIIQVMLISIGDIVNNSHFWISYTHIDFHWYT